MQVKVIGCGSAFSEDGYLFHQCFMISENGKNLFFDMGKDILPWALKKQNLTVKDVHQVLITHLHDDHVGSLGTLALKRYNWAERPHHWKDSKADYAPTLLYSKDLEDDLWSSTKGNLETNEGFVGSLETFFKTRPIADNEHWDFEGWDMQLVRQVHVMAGNSIMSTHGLFMTKGETKVFLTGDCQYFQPRQVVFFYKEATLIITDCETSGTNLLFPEGTLVYTDPDTKKPRRWPTPESDPSGVIGFELAARGCAPEKWQTLKFMSGVHSTYAELAGYESANATKLSDDIKTKMWLSHYGDHVVEGRDGFGNAVDWDAQARSDGLAGFVKPGQVFEFK